MRPSMMGSIVLAAGVIASACSSDVSKAPTSPTAASYSPARRGESLPFRGTITTADQAEIAPPFLYSDGTGEGTATHLGRFTATYSAIADLATPTATGTYYFTAANGDRLVATFAGTAAPGPTGIPIFTEVLTIVSGTGRLAGATGTFTMRRLVLIDFATNTSTSTGSIEGEINLGK